MLYPQNIAKNVFEKGIIVFDTSAFCNLYELKVEDIQKVSMAMTLFKDRIWIPYQVLQEYEKNRRKAINNPLNAINQLKKSFQKYFNKSEFEKKIIEVEKNKIFHPIIPNPDIELFKNDCNELVKKYDSVINFIDMQFSRRKSSIDDFENNDCIYNFIKDCDCGVGFNYIEKLDILKEGHIRYANQIPPGYMDGCACMELKNEVTYSPKQKNKEGFNKYGDLFIWKEVIRHALEKQKSIFFVGEDFKEDWYKCNSCGNLQPRIELLEEFSSNTDSDIVFSDIEGLIKLISSHIGTDDPLSLSLDAIRENLIISTLEKQRDSNNTIVVKFGIKEFEFPLKNRSINWQVDHDYEGATYYHFADIKYADTKYKFELELTVTEFPAGEFYDQEIELVCGKDCPNGEIVREADLSREISFEEGFPCSHCGKYYHENDFDSDYDVCPKCMSDIEKACFEE